MFLWKVSCVAIVTPLFWSTLPTPGKVNAQNENGYCHADGSCLDVNSSKKYANKSAELLVLTVATEPTEGYERFVASIRREGLELETLGMDEEWRGGDVLRLPGGGHKVNLLKRAMEKYK
ncbi:procollagen-lysine, partial [Tropilaelaps mercedesae]